MNLPDLKTIDVRGKRIFLRMDLDAPLTELKMEVGDDTRLIVGMPTLEYLLLQGARVIVGGHVRRPNGHDPKLSVRPVAEWIRKNIKYQISPPKADPPLAEKFKIVQEKIDEFEGWRLSENLLILENLRFYKEETEDFSKPEALVFARKLASLADIYVNDSFASSHRSHASIIGIPKFLPHYAGFHLQEEIRVLSSILENPKRPLVVIIGGEKIETKLPLVSKMCQLADYVLVGGKIAQEMEFTRSKIIQRSPDQRSKIRCAFLVANINPAGTDIDKNSVDNFIEVIRTAQTIVWNGPMGVINSGQKKFTKEDSEYGTYRLANAIVESKAYTIAGGGDTLEFLKQVELLDKFNFFSTGGGAMLSFLSGEELPGIKALCSKFSS